MKDPNNNGNNVVVPKKKKWEKMLKFLSSTKVHEKVILAMIKWSFNILQDDPSIDLKN